MAVQRSEMVGLFIRGSHRTFGQLSVSATGIYSYSLALVKVVPLFGGIVDANNQPVEPGIYLLRDKPSISVTTSKHYNEVVKLMELNGYERQAYSPHLHSGYQGIRQYVRLCHLNAEFERPYTRMHD